MPTKGIATTSSRSLSATASWETQTGARTMWAYTSAPAPRAIGVPRCTPRATRGAISATSTYTPESPAAGRTGGALTVNGTRGGRGRAEYNNSGTVHDRHAQGLQQGIRPPAFISSTLTRAVRLCPNEPSAETSAPPPRSPANPNQEQPSGRLETKGRDEAYRTRQRVEPQYGNVSR